MKGAISFILIFHSLMAISQQNEYENLELSKELEIGNIVFFVEMSNSHSVIGSQQHVFLLDHANVIVDTLDEVSNLKRTNLIQYIEAWDTVFLSIGTMKNLLAYKLVNDSMVLVKNIPQNKAFAPVKKGYNRRYLSAKGFVGIYFPYKGTQLVVNYHHEKNNYMGSSSIYLNETSDRSVISKIWNNRQLSFFNNNILFNDFNESKSIVFNELTGEVIEVDLPLPLGYLFSFLCYDNFSHTYYVISKNKGNHSILSIFDINSKTTIGQMWKIDKDIYDVSYNRARYKKLLENEHVLGLFSVPLDSIKNEKYLMLDEIIIEN